MRYVPATRLAVALMVNSSNGRVLPRGMAGAVVELAEVVADALR